MKTAAVILNYNDPEATKGAVERLRHFKAIDDVIVVDNASTDDSARKLGSYLKRINAEDADGGPDRYTLVLSDRNGGYGYGNNIGLRYACEITGSGLCLIANPDSVFDEGLVGAMKSCFEDEEVAAAGAVIRSGSSMTYGDLRASAWPLRARSANKWKLRTNFPSSISSREALPPSVHRGFSPWENMASANSSFP